MRREALFEQALAIDPNDPDALADAARTYFMDYYYQWGTDAIDYDAKVIGQARPSHRPRSRQCLGL